MTLRESKEFVGWLCSRLVAFYVLVLVITTIVDRSGKQSAASIKP